MRIFFNQKAALRSRPFFMEFLSMHFKKVKTLKALKKCLKKTLPEKVSQVLESYEAFSERPVPEDAKGFSAHHGACKSAVIHAETLLKLAKWTEDEKNPAATDAPPDDILRLLSEARAELDGFNDDED